MCNCPPRTILLRTHHAANHIRSRLDLLLVLPGCTTHHRRLRYCYNSGRVGARAGRTKERLASALPSSFTAALFFSPGGSLSSGKNPIERARSSGQLLDALWLVFTFVGWCPRSCPILHHWPPTRTNPIQEAVDAACKTISNDRAHRVMTEQKHRSPSSILPTRAYIDRYQFTRPRSSARPTSEARHVE